MRELKIRNWRFFNRGLLRSIRYEIAKELI